MAAKGNAQPGAAFTARLEKSRKEIAGSLARAMALTRCSQVAAARSMRVTERTVWSWLHGERPVDVEAVFASNKLGAAFRQELCIHEHEGFVLPTKKRGEDG